MARPSDQSPSPHPLQRRLIAQLQLERRAHGHGTAAELDQRIGKSEGYIGRVLRGEISLQTEQLFKILEAFEVEPAAFFATVVGSDFSPRRFLKHWARSLDRSSPKRALQISKERDEAIRNLLETPSSHLQCFENHKNGSRLEPYPTRNDQEFYDAAQQIAELTFSGSEETLSSASKLLETAHEAYVAGRASGTALATVLGQAAAVERCHGNAGQALSFLRVALAVVGPSSQAEVGLLLEAAEQLMPNGQSVAAELMVDMAQRQAIWLGDGHLLGKTLLARGGVAQVQNLPAEALLSFEASLKYLPAEDWRSHVLANLRAARCHLENNEMFQAGRFLAQAEDLHATRRGPHWAALQWAKADWVEAGATSRDDLETAAELYGKALAALDPPRQPLEAVRIHLSQAKVLLKLGAQESLRRTAAAALQLSGPMKNAQPVHGLVLRFATLAMTGELTETWLDNAAAGITTIEGLRAASRDKVADPRPRPRPSRARATG